MARGRGKPQSQAQSRAEDRILAISSRAGKANTPRRSNRRADADPPDVYQDLLSEAAASSPREDLPERPLKRRRIGQTRAQPVSETSPGSKGPIFIASDTNSDGGSSKRQPQTVTDSDDSEDSDIDWEQVGLDQSDPASSVKRPSDVEIADIAVEVGPKSTPKKIAAARRKPITTAEKLVRIAAHKAHLLFLLFHVHVRNAWCKTAPVETSLRPVLSARIISMLNPRSDLPQLRRSDLFNDGLKLAVDLWRVKFSVTQSGMQKAQWIEDRSALQERIANIREEMDPIDKAGFMKAARSLYGSQDIGNQLFCALLRAVGVEARLVCSLQPLPLSSAGLKLATPQSQKTVIYANAESEHGGSSTDEGSLTGSASETNGILKPKIAIPRQRRRLGQPSFGMPLGSYQQSPPTAKKKKIRKLEYPVFWVEAFNTAHQKWLPVDPTVTGTVSKPARLEPPASYEMNALSYVIAFEESGVAIDVTRRYARAYNAKTRKLRIESTENGNKWWNMVLGVFSRHHKLDRDQLEEAELSKKEAQEGMPGNIQDFKDHPSYALERHLKRHEVIWPKREVGKINAGKSSTSNLESIYRRSDVQIVRSADKWYRFGREIKTGEQALKTVAARSRKGQAGYDSEEEEATTSGLYAFSQTELYVPPPVVRCRVPKNQYGNLDIYTPSMIPAGGVHIRHALAMKAARLLSIDYAQAVTGFQFKGRHGTAITTGVIIAKEYEQSVQDTIAGFELEQKNDEETARSAECLRLWRRFVTGLRIAQRIGLKSTATEEDSRLDKLKEQMDEAEDEHEETFEAGGFFPDEGADNVTQPTATSIPARPAMQKRDDDDLDAPGVRRRRRVASDSDDDDPDDPSYQGQTTTRPAPKRLRRRLIADDDDEEDMAYDPSAFTESEMTNRNGHSKTPDQSLASREPELDLVERLSHTAPPSKIADAHDLVGGSGAEGRDNSTSNLGGGFMPDEDENNLDGGVIASSNSDELEGLGGGFVVETADLQSGSTPSFRKSSVDANELGGGFMVDDEPGHEVHNAPVRASHSPLSIAEPGETNDEPERTLPDEDGGREHAEVVDGEESDGSPASLPSHDPDDDDAEPEWLADD